MIILYGIKQCDTCRKAIKWLDQQEIKYQFHDLRVDGFDETTLSAWLDHVSFEDLLNKRSTSWRNLTDADRNKTDAESLKALLLGHPTLVKRPVIFDKEVLAIGFDVNRWLTILS